LFPDLAEAPRRRPFLAAGAGLLLCGVVLTPDLASAKEALSVDLSAGATVSSNPFLDPGGGKAEAGAQAGIDAHYNYASERTTLGVDAGGQTSYFHGRGTDVSGEVSADLQHAKVYVSVMGSERDRNLTLHGLRSAAGFIQSKVGDRMKSRYVPILQFVLDEGVRNSQEVARLLAEERTRNEESGVRDQESDAGPEPPAPPPEDRTDS